MAEGYAIYFDSSYCIGCKGCQLQCKVWNDLPSTLEKNSQEWNASYQNPADLNQDTRLIVTFNEADNGQKWGVNWAIGRRACMHCTNAGCVDVCPSGCLYHDEETGMVAFDAERCIGCQFCRYACPFDVPRHENTTLFSGDIVVDKCDGCLSRLEKGMTPACVLSCQPHALEYGPWDEMVEKAHKRVEELHALGYKDARVYGEHELGGLHQIQVLKYDISQYELPDNPEQHMGIPLLNAMKPLAAIGAAGVVLGLGLTYLTNRGYERQTIVYDEDNHNILDAETGEVVRHIDKEKDLLYEVKS